MLIGLRIPKWRIELDEKGKKQEIKSQPGHTVEKL